MLALEGLEVGYRSDFRLGPVNQVFPDGLTCLVGANGSGQSTLLRVLARVQ